MNKKDRKHSGRYTPKILSPSMKFDKIKSEALEPNEEYDDWINYRDGFRDYEAYKRKIKEKKKQKHL